MHQKEFIKIKKILKFVWNSPYSSFYRNKYKKAGFKNVEAIKSISDFKKLPFLTKDEILQAPLSKRTFISEREVIAVQVTSGTTGRPLIIPEKRLKRYSGGKKVSVHKALYDLMRKKRIKKTLILRTSSGFNIYWMAEQIDVFRFFADINDLSGAAIMAKDLEIDALEASPTVAYFFAQYLSEVYDLKKIKLIRLLGEYCSEAKYKVLKEIYPKAALINFYSSSEGSVIGYQCADLVSKKPWIFHLAEQVYLESLDDLTDREVPEGEEGACVITSLEQRGFVPIRYETEDRVILLKDKCGCGRKTRLFAALGRRSFNSFRLQGGNLTREAMEKALNLLKADISPDFRVHIYERLLGKKLFSELEIELVPLNKKLVNNDRFAAKVRNIIQKNLYFSPSFTLEDLVAEKVFLPLKIKLLEALPFEQKRRVFIPHF